MFEIRLDEEETKDTGEENTEEMKSKEDEVEDRGVRMKSFLLDVFLLFFSHSDPNSPNRKWIISIML